MNAEVPNQLPSADFSITGGGTVYLFHPFSDAAKEWLAMHCPSDQEHQYLGKSLAIEHRFVGDMIQLAIDAGLTIAPLNPGRN